ncbi:AlpA family phage regulatory protein [Roseomonas alkaliterrae]|jgi:predicted DNA-binding transcriptional regulator AlpA|uniref:helix-turn-helix transcriptional regulator n=1 Tax=Neoroseomonas alkaliterrae TaxID=1452450 RepID=UPI001BACD6AE|nr:AlpA family phage regulatory protein [Neoroseomonas alkaliterrae]MBR0676655.1 AlpA family phage regulatory protein [Neoroseomonas alkaliterrae]
MPDAPLPFTPRALRAELAALYCGMSESAWLALVKGGGAPPPVRLTPRIPVWLREDLDAWLDARAGRAAASMAANPWDAPPDARRPGR